MAGRSFWERRWTPVAAGGVPVAVFSALALVTTLVDHNQDHGAGGFFGVGFVVAALVVGFVVAKHQPRNPIGWLLLAVPACVGGFLLCQAVTVATFRDHPLVAVACGIATELLYYAFILCAPLIILFFPDGRLPSSRWRRALRAYLVMGVALLLVTAGWGVEIAARGSWHFTATGTISGKGPPAVAGLATNVLLLGCLVLALGWVVRRIATFRSSTDAVRQQYKWLATGAVCFVVALVLSNVTTGGHSTFNEVDNALTGALALPFPVTIGIAILRYRLYEIDRVISRTVSYALLTGILVGLYVGVVAFAEDVLPFSSPVAVAASTLVAVAAFNPLRRRLQRLVDRRFNRSRYDAEAIVSAFAERLRSTLGLGTVEGDLLHAVSRTLEPSAVAVWLRPPPRATQSEPELANA